MEYKVEIETPVLGGFYKNLFSYRVFARVDFSEFKVVRWNTLSNSDLEEYIKETGAKDITNRLNEVLEWKQEKVEKALKKAGLVKIDYLFPRLHHDIESISTFNDYINWIDWTSVFTRPLYYEIKAKTGERFYISKVVPQKVNLIIVFHFVEKERAPIVYEALGKGSEFIIESTTELKLKEPLQFRIRKLRNLGYGLIKFSSLK